jgi:hypothetical protein
MNAAAFCGLDAVGEVRHMFLLLGTEPGTLVRPIRMTVEAAETVVIKAEVSLVMVSYGAST